MTESAANPSIPTETTSLRAYVASGLALLAISVVVVSIARSASPVVLKVHGRDGVEGLYGTGGAEYFWVAVGAVIGFAGASLIAVAVLAKGIQLGRR